MLEWINGAGAGIKRLKPFMTKDTIPLRSFGDIHKLVFETETDIGLYRYPR